MLMSMTELYMTPAETWHCACRSLARVKDFCLWNVFEAPNNSFGDCLAASVETEDRFFFF